MSHFPLDHLTSRGARTILLFNKQGSHPRKAMPGPSPQQTLELKSPWSFLTPCSVLSYTKAGRFSGSRVVCPNLTTTNVQKRSPSSSLRTARCWLPRGHQRVSPSQGLSLARRSPPHAPGCPTPALVVIEVNIFLREWLHGTLRSDLVLSHWLL